MTSHRSLPGNLCHRSLCLRKVVTHDTTHYAVVYRACVHTHTHMDMVILYSSE